MTTDRPGCGKTFGGAASAEETDASNAVKNPNDIAVTPSHRVLKNPRSRRTAISSSNGGACQPNHSGSFGKRELTGKQFGIANRQNNSSGKDEVLPLVMPRAEVIPST